MAEIAKSWPLFFFFEVTKISNFVWSELLYFSQSVSSRDNLTRCNSWTRLTMLYFVCLTSDKCSPTRNFHINKRYILFATEWKRIYNIRIKSIKRSSVIILANRLVLLLLLFFFSFRPFKNVSFCYAIKICFGWITAKKKKNIISQSS